MTRRWVATWESSFGHPDLIRGSPVGAVPRLTGPAGRLVGFVLVACRYESIVYRYENRDDRLRVSWCPT